MYEDESAQTPESSLVRQKGNKALDSYKEPDDKDDVEQKYEEAVALLPKDKQQAVQAYCDAIFDSGAYAEQFFYRLGLKDGIRLYKTVKSIIKGIS